jgi:hypothetical protein
MNMQTIIAEARHRIEALDLSAENARIEQIDAQLAQIEQAMTAARERNDQIGILLRPFRRDGGSLPMLTPEAGTSVANALLAGVDPSVAAGSTIDAAQLEHERDALKEGISELVARDRSLRATRRGLPSATGRRIMAELKPLCDVLEQQAREAAQVIERAFAALCAISNATRTHASGLDGATNAVLAMQEPGGLLASRTLVDVPDEITGLLKLLQAKGPGYKGGAPTSVQVHDPRAASELVDAMLRPSGHQGAPPTYQ